MKDYIKEWNELKPICPKCGGAGINIDWESECIHDCDVCNESGKQSLTDFLLQKIEDAYADGQNSILNKMKELGMDWEVDQVVEAIALKGE